MSPGRIGSAALLAFFVAFSNPSNAQSQSESSPLDALQQRYQSLSQDYDTLQEQLEITIQTLRQESAAHNSALERITQLEETLTEAQAKLAAVTAQAEEHRQTLAEQKAQSAKATEALAKARRDLETTTRAKQEQQQAAGTAVTTISALREAVERLDNARIEAENAAARAEAELASAQQALAVERQENQAATSALAQERAARQSLESLQNSAGGTANISEEELTALQQSNARLRRLQRQNIAAKQNALADALQRELADSVIIEVADSHIILSSRALFARDRAVLLRGGRSALNDLAAFLLRTLPRLGLTGEWVLRIDGHAADANAGQSIGETAWYLSSERALVVAQFLVQQGFPSGRLAATGFAHHRPRDPGGGVLSYWRNDRIELNLARR